jgi:hypothetical protein
VEDAGAHHRRAEEEADGGAGDASHDRTVGGRAAADRVVRTRLDGW